MWDNVNELIRLFFNICLLKAKPQDVPTSQFFTVTLGLVNLFSGAAVLAYSFGGFIPAFQAQMLDVVLMALVLRTALQLANKSERFYQSLSALYGTGILITLFSLPLIMMAPDLSAQSGSAQGGPWVLFYLLLVFWSIAIGAHIIRHTFEIPFTLGIAFSVSYFIVIINLVQPLAGTGAV